MSAPGAAGARGTLGARGARAAPAAPGTLGPPRSCASGTRGVGGILKRSADFAQDGSKRASESPR
eukprot:461409-Pyramimonas_sp.AAC.1